MEKVKKSRKLNRIKKKKFNADKLYIPQRNELSKQLEVSKLLNKLKASHPMISLIIRRNLVQIETESQLDSLIDELTFIV